MNLVGKIFVVLILIMSVVFMAFSVAVFAFHKNWRDVVLNDKEAPGKPLGLKLQLDQLNSQLADVESQRTKLQVELENEKASRARAVAKLTTEVSDIRQERDKLQNDEAKRKQELDDAVAAMHDIQATLANLRDEVDKLRTAGENARKERDTALAASVLLEDQLAQQKGELDRLKKRETQLAAQNAKFEIALQNAQAPLDPNPPRVDGVITDSRNNGLVEISIGSDDGLAVGNELDVFRLGGDANSSKYLGRIRVVRTEPDRAVAQIIPELRQGAIQKDDRVSTKLR